MALYEVTFIARQDISTSDVDKLVEIYTAMIIEYQGIVVKTEHWGLRSLAYIINKNRKGHYVMLAIDAPFEAIKELERRMKLNEDIIRILVIKVDAIDPEPSQMMNLKSSDEETITINVADDLDVVDLTNIDIEEEEIS